MPGLGKTLTVRTQEAVNRRGRREKPTKTAASELQVRFLATMTGTGKWRGHIDPQLRPMDQRLTRGVVTPKGGKKMGS